MDLAAIAHAAVRPSAAPAAQAALARQRWGTLVGYAGGVRWWGTLVGYAAAQAALAEAQLSHDPNVLGAFVAAHPSHPEGLLQVGE